MGPIRLLAAPLRRIANSRLFQLAVVVAIILSLDYYSYDYALLRQIADGLKTRSPPRFNYGSEHFRVGILTDPCFRWALMIAYVYVVCLLIFFVTARRDPSHGRPRRVE